MTRQTVDYDRLVSSTPVNRQAALNTVDRPGEYTDIWYEEDPEERRELRVTKDEIARCKSVALLHSWWAMLEEKEDALTSQMEARTKAGIAPDDWTHGASHALGWVKTGQKAISRRLRDLGVAVPDRSAELATLKQRQAALVKSERKAMTDALFCTTARELLPPDTLASIQAEFGRRLNRLDCGIEDPVPA